MNQAWIISVMLAHTLIVYAGLLEAAVGHGHEHRWWGWEPRTIRARMISIAAVIIRHARRLILRVDRPAPWQSLLRAVLGHQQQRTPAWRRLLHPWHCFLFLLSCIRPLIFKEAVLRRRRPEHPGRFVMR